VIKRTVESDVSASRWLGLLSFMVTHFSTVVLTYRGRFRRTGLRPHCRYTGLLHFAAIVQIAEPSFFHLLRKVDCFRDLCH
jgi:hypothetical protein